MKSKRAKATDITQAVKNAVWERDGHCCILCGNQNARPNAHYIPRSHGGLGIEQNIVTLCFNCHYRLDHTDKRDKLLECVRLYLDTVYPDFTDEERIYKKW